MKGSSPERRLAAILAADVVGYSRLIGLDEVGTLGQLRRFRREFIDPAILERGGRIVKTMGDGLLAEFPSAVQAVACAITVQKKIASENALTPEVSRLTLRIGINVGDIVFEEGDIFGDGVNVAARLESLCEPGGLCISRAVRDQVRDKLPVAFADRGEQALKNISRPVRVFALPPDAIAAARELPPPAGSHGGPRRLLAAGCISILLILAAASAWWASLEWPRGRSIATPQTNNRARNVSEPAFKRFASVRMREVSMPWTETSVMEERLTLALEWGPEGIRVNSVWWSDRMAARSCTLQGSGRS